jgi:hypothetical protein
VIKPVNRGGCRPKRSATGPRGGERRPGQRSRSPICGRDREFWNCRETAPKHPSGLDSFLGAPWTGAPQLDRRLIDSLKGHLPNGALAVVHITAPEIGVDTAIRCDDGNDARLAEPLRRSAAR